MKLLPLVAPAAGRGGAGAKPPGFLVTTSGAGRARNVGTTRAATTPTAVAPAAIDMTARRATVWERRRIAQATANTPTAARPPATASRDVIAATSTAPTTAATSRGNVR